MLLKKLSLILTISFLSLVSFSTLGPSREPPLAEANHANGQLSDGIGFQYLAPNDYGYVGVYVVTGQSTAANDAITAWNGKGLQYLVRHVVIKTTSSSAAQVEIRDKTQNSIFGQVFTDVCTNFFNDPNNSGFYAAAFILDTSGAWRGLDRSTGFMNKNPNYPFDRVSICLNTAYANNKGTIAHELGHALGLDDLNWNKGPTDRGPCTDTGRDSIMAYNYSNWSAQWPSDLKPTKEDLVGQWVCNLSNAGGLDYIYKYTTTPGMGNPVKIDVRVGIMNGTLNPVRNNGTDPVKYGMTLVNFSNTTIYNVKAVIGAKGNTYTVRTKTSLAPNASTTIGYTPTLYYGGWANGSIDQVNFGGDYYITPSDKGGTVNHPTPAILREHVVTNLSHTRVQFMETNVNPVNRNAPVTFKIQVCNVLYAGPAYVRPVIGSDGGTHPLDWEYLSFLQCTQTRSYTEYYGSTGTDWVGFGGERYGTGGIPAEYILQQVIQ